MSLERGSLSINSENIFPIIKKWLYSDHDIFIRELVSNANDAITKLKKLEMVGEAQLPADTKYEIKVSVNQEEKTIKVIDNGIGMTADEVKEYINQIAFSGAEAFLAKYKDKTSEDQIIGHFGLGFYSAFMVAHKVTIDTLSYQEGAQAVHWVSEEGVDFEMGAGERTARGTEITLYLNEDSYEFSNEYRMKECLEKYCSFMPVPIYFINENAAPVKEEPEEADDAEELLDEADEADEADEDIIDVEVDENGVAADAAETTESEKEAKKAARKAEKEAKKAERARKKAEKKEAKKGPQPINDTNPLWTKHPNDCKEEEYKEFYRKLFRDYKEPLFWIHLNMDYPFNLKGILYFPKLNTEYDNLEGVIKLYSNQVFIADNIKEVIPEFLLLLKGVIDCPDLPLNVSRSALQNDGFVKKISEYITKKVADKLTGMYKVERESYEKFWDDISPFIKYGCLKDTKFREKMKDSMIFKTLDGTYVTLPEYIEAEKKRLAADGAEAENADGSKAEDTEQADDTTVKDAEQTVEQTDGEEAEKKKDTVYYVTDEQQQSQYINLFRAEGISALLLTHNIDQPFIQQLEQENDTISFKRIDAGLTDSMVEETDAEELKAQNEALTELFRKVLNKEKLEVKVEKLKDAAVSAMVTLSEESRRMQDMMKMYAMPGMGMDDEMFGGGETLILNANNELVQYVFEHQDGEHVNLLCEQLYDLAMLSHQPLKPEAMTKFVARSNTLMCLIIE